MTVMTEAPPICHNISVTFIPSWVVFHITAKMGFYFQMFILGLVYREMWEMMLLGLTVLKTAYLPWNPLCMLQPLCWQPSVTVSVTSNVNFRP